MSELHIYKASAGSGKTFRLTLEYLKIALSNPLNYRNILAVTFTNKATTEMKYRVVGELYRMGKGDQTPSLNVLKAELGLTGEELAARAQRCLKGILHDYSRLSISTIDSFFQRVIRAFSREMGIHTAYQVDLDDEQILEEAVDALLMSIDENRDLLEWMKQFALEKIREGGSWNLKGEIMRLGRQIYNETFKEFGPALFEKLNDRVFIGSYRDELQGIISRFEGRLRQIGEQGVRIISDAGYTAADFKFGATGPASSFARMLSGELKIGERIITAAADYSALCKTPASPELESTARKLQPLLAEAVDFQRKNIRDYHTAKLITSQLYTLGILVDLQEMVRKICRDKGVVLISESGSLLRQIIADSDAPFVYEKTGVFYRHFMIDEFQDTSGLQWNNFKPLIGNSLAENNFAMVVGDVKQAIYRWRNGDWNLLASEVRNAFPAAGFSEKKLDRNWRSAGQIIRFNNRIFQVIPELLEQHIGEELSEAGESRLSGKNEITGLYDESDQEPGRSTVDQEGYIRMRFLKKKKKTNDPDEEDAENRTVVLDDMVLQIKLLQEKGANARDIAILVRKKEEAAIVANRLLKEKAEADGPWNFNVLSGESLYVKNADSVSFVLAVLAFSIDPSDKLSLAKINYLYYSRILPEMQKAGKLPDLETAQAGEQLSLNFAQSYRPELSAQFESYQEEENKLYLFMTSESFSETLASRNLQEAIFKICEIFHLFLLRDEVAYLQAFIDQVNGFMQSRKTDTLAFLSWWEEKGCEKTISVSEDVDAVRIQTIHKAKGLEYNYVFIPFCDWSVRISGQHAPVLWCRPSAEPFSRLETMPVRYAQMMRDSHFSGEYFTEKRNACIDNLNLLYVAFTRARQALFTWSVPEENMSSVGDWLLTGIDLDRQIPVEEHKTLPLSAYYNAESQTLEVGALPLTGDGKPDGNKNSLRLQDAGFSDFSRYLKLRRNYENFFDAGKQPGRNINKGRLIHELLARIRHADDLNPAVSELTSLGMISRDAAEEIRGQLQDLLNDPAVKGWFDGTFRVVNERNILTGKSGLKRPDRIMISDNRVIVVDYKSGEKELDAYFTQVRSYMRALQACGYTHVVGYIWYTRTNKRVEVPL